MSASYPEVSYCAAPCRAMMVSAGRMLIMQPDAWHWFMGPEPDHPLLPPGADVYLLGAAPPPNTTTPKPTTTTTTPASSQSSYQDDDNAVSSTAKAREAAAAASAATHGMTAAAAVRDEVATLWWLMDNPHPLDMLADPGAYLEL